VTESSTYSMTEQAVGHTLLCVAAAVQNVTVATAAAGPNAESNKLQQLCCTATAAGVECDGPCSLTFNAISCCYYTKIMGHCE